MKRILIFSHIYLPYIGGAEIAIKEITDRIKDTEMDTEFVMITGWRSRKFNKEELLDNIKIYRVGLGFFQLDQYLYPVLALLKALSLNAKSKFDMTWAMMPSQAGMAAMLFKLFKPKIPYLLTDQSGDSDMFWKIRTFFWLPIFKLIYKKADRVQVISEFLAKRAEKYSRPGSIHIIPNGVDIDLFTQSISSETKTELKNKLNITNERVIISVSRLVHKNGLDTLIKAMKYIDNAKLILIGSGDQEKKLRVLDIDNKTIFLGNIPNKEIPMYLSIADVFVRPSRSEGQGISFIEAMATGVPVVATPVGGIVDFIEHEKTGLLAKVDNPADVAQNIKKLLTNESLRNEIIKNSQELIREKYNWNNIARDMNVLFKKLIN